MVFIKLSARASHPGGGGGGGGGAPRLSTTSADCFGYTADLPFSVLTLHQTRNHRFKSGRHDNSYPMLKLTRPWRVHPCGHIGIEISNYQWTGSDFQKPNYYISR